MTEETLRDTLAGGMEADYKSFNLMVNTICSVATGLDKQSPGAGSRFVSQMLDANESQATDIEYLKNIALLSVSKVN